MIRCVREVTEIYEYEGGKKNPDHKTMEQLF